MDQVKYWGDCVVTHRSSANIVVANLPERNPYLSRSITEFADLIAKDRAKVA
jgi:hypothetical protein